MGGLGFGFIEAAKKKKDELERKMQETKTGLEGKLQARKTELKGKLQETIDNAKDKLELKTTLDGVLKNDVFTNSVTGTLVLDALGTLSALITKPFSTIIDWNSTIVSVIQKLEKAKKDTDDNDRPEKIINGLQLIINKLSKLKKEK